MSEADYLTFSRERAKHKGAARRQGRDRARATRHEFARQGTLDFVDNALDRSSGTIHARATVPNPDLPPDARASSPACGWPSALPRRALLVPDAAVLPDQSQHIVMTVSPRRHGRAKAGRRSAISAAACASSAPASRRTTASSSTASRYAAPGIEGRAAGRHDPRTPPLAETRTSAESMNMRLDHFFIDRPRFATVLNIFVTVFGLGALAFLPVAQYPEIVPPTVQITTSYPGASAETVARTVATPLEQEINGVENMLYMSSQSTGDGKLTITVTFQIGTDLNVAQMLTQNRVQDALSRLPEDVQRLGVQVRKTTPASSWPFTSTRRTSRATRFTSRTTRPCTSRTCSRASRALAMCSSRAAANTPCASGSIRTRLRPTISTPARCLRRCARRTCRSRPVF